MSQSVQILIQFIISHFIYVSTLTEIKESVMGKVYKFNILLVMKCELNILMVYFYEIEIYE